MKSHKKETLLWAEMRFAEFICQIFNPITSESKNKIIADLIS